MRQLAKTRERRNDVPARTRSISHAAAVGPRGENGGGERRGWLKYKSVTINASVDAQKVVLQITSLICRTIINRMEM